LACKARQDAALPGGYRQGRQSPLALDLAALLATLGQARQQTAKGDVARWQPRTAKAAVE